MKTAVTYLRMSTDRQEYSIESQSRLIHSFALQNGYSILRDYIDEGISGRKAEKRPQFLQMIEDSAKGEFQYVIIYDSSRFARNLEQSLLYKSLLKKNGVMLLSITEPVLDEDTSLITDALFGAMNEMYSRKLSKNVKRGMEQKALRGEFCGNIPFGYAYDKAAKMLVPDSKEAPIAAYIFREILAGRTPYAIACGLREKNIRTKAGTFLERRRIEYIIRNPIYKGYIRHSADGHEIVQKSTHIPLLTEEAFDEIQKITEERAAKHRRSQKPAERCSHWLSGMLYCSECGCVYTYVKATKNKKARFRCSGQSRGRCSSAISFSVSCLEELVILLLREITERDTSLYVPLPCKPVSLPMDHETEIRKCHISLERAKKAFLAGLDTLAEYGETKKRLSAEIERLELLRQAEQKADNPAPLPPLTDLTQLLQSDIDPLLKKEAFRAVVEKIIIGKETKTLSLYFFAS